MKTPTREAKWIIEHPLSVRYLVVVTTLNLILTLLRAFGVLA